MTTRVKGLSIFLSLSLALLAGGITPEPASAQARTRRPPASAEEIPEDLVRGRTVTFSRNDGAVSGELLAVSPDSAWLLLGRSVSVLPLEGIERARIRRHSLTPGKIAIWTGIGAALTGGGLYSACSEVADDCGGVFVSTALSWVVAGLIAGVSVHRSGSRETGATVADLRPYARFPQGLPPGYRPPVGEAGEGDPPPR